MMPTLQRLSSYGVFLFGLSVLLSFALFAMAWLRGF